MAVTAARAFELMEGAHGRKRLAHAFLISGRPGSGKRALAARVIGMVNPPPDAGGSDLFGESVAPAAVPELESLEGEFVRILQPRSKSRRIVVDDVRALEHSMHLAAPRGTWKVGVIVDAERMFDQPANAFLKTLEEPPPNCLLLLLTAHPDVLLPTIRSRCVSIVLQAAERHEVMGEEERRSFVRVLGLGAEKLSAHRALLLKSAFEAILADHRKEIDGAGKAAYKEEEAHYKQSTDGTWLEEREKFHDAAAASEYLALRSALVDWLVAWLGDALRQRVGGGTLGFPEFATETRRFADGLTVDSLLQRLDALEGMQDLLSTNVSEALALEVSFLRAFGP